jgi:hypothetical protein
MRPCGDLFQPETHYIKIDAVGKAACRLEFFLPAAYQ